MTAMAMEENTHEMDLLEKGVSASFSPPSSSPIKSKPSWRSVSYASCLACLGFIIVIVQLAIPIIKDLLTNDHFWDSAQKIIALYERFNRSCTSKYYYQDN